MKISEAYRDQWESVKDLVDSYGWIRICSKTPPDFMEYYNANSKRFEIKTEFAIRGIKSYVRPKILNTFRFTCQ